MRQHVFNGIQQYSAQARIFFLIVAGMGFAIDGVYTVLLNLYLLRLDYGTEFIGLVNAVGLLSFALTSLPAGLVGTRTSNLGMMRLGVGIVAGGSLILPLAQGLPGALTDGGIVASYAMMMCGFSIFFVNAAPFLMDLVRTDQRSAAFAAKTALLSLAAFVGSLAGGLIPEVLVALHNLTGDNPEPYRLTLLLVVLVMLGVWGLSFALKPIENAAAWTPANAAAPPPTDAPTWSGSLLLVISLMAVVRLLQVAGSAATVVYFNVYMDSVLLISTGAIGLIAAVGRLAGVVTAFMVPRLVRRWGNERVIIGGALATAACMLPLALFENGFAASIGFIGVLAMTAIRYAAFVVYILELVPKVQQSVMSGSGEMAGGLSFSVMALGGGILLSIFTFRDLFLLGAGMTVLGTLIFWGHVRSVDKRKLRPMIYG